MTSVPLMMRRQVRQRNEDAGIADRVVIQEIARAGVEVVRVERPSAQRDAQADIVLDVALARQRNEAIRLVRWRTPARARKLSRGGGW